MNSGAMLLLGALVAQNLIQASAVPHFEVDLDVPPRQRWVHVTSYWREYTIAMGKAMEPMIREHLGDDFDAWCRIADEAFDAEADEEFRGMKEILNSPTSNLTYMKLTNLLYELQSPTMCSGVLWAMENGTVIHGRNMDYAMHFNMTDSATGKTRTLNWPDVTFEVLFKRNGRPLYTATMWPGTVGINTAMRPGGWSFEQNTRQNNNAKENLAAAQQGGKPNGLVARRLMERTSDFETAVQALYSEKFMAPQYFIMSGSGPYEGAVLTIDRLGKHEDYSPPIMRINSSARAWHLVQTNDDQLATPLDPRRPIANQMLASMHQDEISVPHMFEFMHSPPLFNPMTVFTTVMVPGTGYYHTILPNETFGGSFIQKGRRVKLHAPASQANRQRQLRGARTESDSDGSAFMQVAIESLDL